MEKKNIEWINNLRVISVLAVITIHVAGPFLFEFYKPVWWHTGNILDSLSRFCVPVFIMISGALWFSDPSPAKVFYKKKVSRLLLPFLFWSFISYLIATFYIQGETDFSYVLTDFYEKFRNAQILAHFWYVYMLIGLFLIAPVFKTWINNVGETEVRLYLIVWILVLFYQSPVFNNIRIELDLKGIYNYSGYLVLGYYLANYNGMPAQKQKKIGMILYIAGALFTIISTYMLCFAAKVHSETFYGYLSLNVVIASIGIFLWFKQLHVKGTLLKRGIHSVAKYSYGIYLVHLIIESVIIKWWTSYTINPLLYVSCVVFICFFVSWGTIYLMSKLPYSKYYIG